MALPRTGIRGDAGIWPEVNVLIREMMAMVFWNGAHWAFWLRGLITMGDNQSPVGTGSRR